MVQVRHAISCDFFKSIITVLQIYRMVPNVRGDLFTQGWLEHYDSNFFCGSLQGNNGKELGVGE